MVQTCLIADDLPSESVEYGMRVHLFGRSCASPPRREKRKLKIIGSFGSANKLRPFLDGEGMLRVGGRIQNSSLDHQSKNQLLLPSKHHVTKHESVGHLGQEYVLTCLRQKYWIVKGRAAVQRVHAGNKMLQRANNSWQIYLAKQG